MLLLLTEDRKSHPWLFGSVTEMTAIYMTLVVLLLQVIFSSMLIHGVRMDIPCLMAPQMVMKLLGIMFSSLALIVLVVVFVIYSMWRTLLFCLPSGLYIFLETYFLQVLRVHYIDIKRSAEDFQKLLEETPGSGEVGIPFQPKTIYQQNYLPEVKI
nr:uncharacterized protein LOC128686090 [Cherax quadricarinatus]XP_053628719.1 uncharacterized protein LOC128686090 [Cherax quadricarinatus]